MYETLLPTPPQTGSGKTRRKNTVLRVPEQELNFPHLRAAVEFLDLALHGAAELVAHSSEIGFFQSLDISLPQWRRKK